MLLSLYEREVFKAFFSLQFNIKILSVTAARVGSSDIFTKSL